MSPLSKQVRTACWLVPQQFHCAMACGIDSHVQGVPGLVTQNQRAHIWLLIPPFLLLGICLHHGHSFLGIPPCLDRIRHWFADDEAKASCASVLAGADAAGLEYLNVLGVSVLHPSLC